MAEAFKGLALCKQFNAEMMRRKVRRSSLDTAVETMKLIRKFVVNEKYNSVEEMLNIIADYLHFLGQTFPSELVLRNAFLIFKKLVREESTRILEETDEESAVDSLTNLWHDKKKYADPADMKKLKKNLIESIKEVVLEMEGCRECVVSRAVDLIQSRDVLIIYALNSSPTLQAFVDNRKQKVRIFSVVDSTEIESSPDYLSPVTLCDVGGKMCEVTKVFLPGVAVFPDGSCLVPAGALSICLSAQRHSVPVNVLISFYKITPFFVPDLSEVNPMQGPGLPFACAKKITGKVQVIQPAFDVLPASLVSNYVTNTSSILPSHVYRLIGDYYHKE
ncbi:unnamed protein product [Auanema sp. JU1783]|nr:unnamed protein product [Auanema sp. JU1783]